LTESLQIKPDFVQLGQDIVASSKNCMKKILIKQGKAAFKNALPKAGAGRCYFSYCLLISFGLVLKLF
jgi:hypothetical protein